MALTFSNRFPQRAALVHRGCSNNSVLIGNGVYAVEFAPRYADFRPCLCHKFPPLVSNWSIQLSTSGGEKQNLLPPFLKHKSISLPLILFLPPLPPPLLSSR